jgi:hypothetical protein
MQIEIKYSGLTEVKIKKTEDKIILVTVPFLLAGQLEKLPLDKEFTFSIGTILTQEVDIITEINT